MPANACMDRVGHSSSSSSMGDNCTMSSSPSSPSSSPHYTCNIVPWPFLHLALVWSSFEAVGNHFL
eukprot:Gb_32336 [translate_table: standard]